MFRVGYIDEIIAWIWEYDGNGVAEICFRCAGSVVVNV